MLDAQSFPAHVGTHGDYEWLSTEHSFEDLLRQCPQMVLGKYVAIASYDGGRLLLSDDNRAAGWQSRMDIAFSPRVESIAKLPRYMRDEWYIFADRADLSRISAGVGTDLAACLEGEQVYPFVDFGGFGLHIPQWAATAALFWKQFDRIRPQTYIADNNDILTIVSSDKRLVGAMCLAIERLNADLEDALDSPAEL
jgi:SAM-dependent methyltransferase